MPASTSQKFEAEKVLFRSLRTKHETPKYGLIYHANLVGSANPKLFLFVLNNIYVHSNY